jgi:hypothetical protein
MLRLEGDFERRIRHYLSHPTLAFPDVGILNFEAPDLLRPSRFLWNKEI